MNSGEDIHKNLEFILKGLNQFQGQFLFLPENSLYFNCGSGPLLASSAFHDDHPVIKDLREVCAKRSITLHLGGVPWKVNSRVQNQSVVIDSKGLTHSVYGKTHLFDLELGSIKMKESESFQAGDHLATLEFSGWKMGVSICYDLRFSEIFTYYRNFCGAHILLVPSAFTAVTGESHWKTLLRARAIENQCFVIAPAQCGEHQSQDGSKIRKTWGESLIISPWGQILGEGPSFKDKNSSFPESLPIQCQLDFDAIGSVRKAMPMDQHRRLSMDLELKCSSGNKALHVSHFLLP